MATPSALQIRDLVTAGEREAAADALRAPVAALAGQAVTHVHITSDEYSLNSVSGTADLADGSDVFFKFHVEEGEGAHVGEYYRAQLLADAGLPIDLPLAASTTAGEQLVLYRRRTDRRMVDVCLELERTSGAAAQLPPDLAHARRTLDNVAGAVAVESLKATGVGTSAALHQLFSHRMHTADGHYPGGRLLAWYLSNPEWAYLSELQWELNGVRYSQTLADVVERARLLTAPTLADAGPVVTAHGDDHHGNVWVEESHEECRLVLFDPAFAGDDLPALMALVKPTFHNVFAHPHWLYHPQDVDPTHLTATDAGGVMTVTAPALSPLRLEILDSIVAAAWIPLLRALAERDLLDPRWRMIVRSALSLCPLLVTNLLAATRSRSVQMLGLAHVVMMGSEPHSDGDVLSRALDRMQEAVDSR